MYECDGQIDIFNIGVDNGVEITQSQPTNQPTKAHCMFEQSGTFKNEFIKLGIPAEDYDIQDEFGETDHVVDLYAEIENAYDGKNSIFDNIGTDELIFAFFPCTRFEAQILLWFRGEALQQKNKSDIDKLEKDLELHAELSKNYSLVTKLAIVCLRKNIKLIIENPLSEHHYLSRYWCLKSKVKDTNRRDRGDYMKKPTQYWFIGFEPKNNFVFESMEWVEVRRHNDMFKETTMRSMIHPQYANRFIREFIL